MDNLNFDIEKYLFKNSKSIKDYILLIRNNLPIFIIISLLIIIALFLMQFISKDIYRSTVTVKINNRSKACLKHPLHCLM